MSAPLTLIVEGKPLVFDVPVPVGEVIPGTTPYLYADGVSEIVRLSGPGGDYTVLTDARYFTARPSAAPESFADGDVAWVRMESDGENVWIGADGEVWLSEDDHRMRQWITDGVAILAPSPRPESLADVLDDLGLTDEQRARVEKAVGA